jgi:hypothetical protein
VRHYSGQNRCGQVSKSAGEKQNRAIAIGIGIGTEKETDPWVAKGLFFYRE